MESELKNQNDLLEQLKSLRSEKELLEKHVFVLNECLSVEELKTKISSLEKKKEMLVSLEGVIGRLRSEIEPLKYLKSVLKTKLGDESKIQSNNIGSESVEETLEARAESKLRKQINAVLKYHSDFENNTQSNVGSECCIDTGFYVPKIDFKLYNDSSVDVQPKSTHSGNFKLDIYPKLKDVNLIDAFQKPIPSKSNSVSTVNDGSLDECMQLLDQYDVVTDQEILNFPTEENDLKSQRVDKEPTNLIDIENKIQDAQIKTIETHYFDADSKIKFKSQVPIKNDFKSQSGDQEPTNNIGIENKIQDAQKDTAVIYCFDADGKIKSKSQVPIKKDLELCSNSSVNPVSATFENASSKLHEASTSQPTLNKESLCSDSNVSIGDLLLKIPHLLLQQGIDYIQDEEDVNQSLKNVNVSTDISSKEHNKLNKKNKFEKEFNKLVNDCTNVLLNSSQTTEKTNVSPKQTESGQYDELPPNVSNSECSINSFNDMNLKIDILRGIYSLGFVNPTALQKRIVVHSINGRDIIVFAGPGNGRTMMFTIPLLQRIKTNLNECQALVLVPTRDLAVHIQKIIMSVGDFLGVNVCIGGDNVPRKLSVVPHVVVGTPAGVSNMISCKSLRTGSIQTVVINKAEKMLTSNCTILIEEIMKKITRTRQVTLLTSDKLDHVLDIYMESLRDPLVIINDQEKEYDLLKNLPKQFYLNIQKEWKVNALCEINETLKIQRSIIFCNTLDRAQKLCESLQRLEYAVSLFHLEMNAHDREQKLDMFSSNNLKMLITTDPIKGSQFQQASWIINYDLPINPICYLDRVAKCAENIKVINLIDEDDDQIKLAIETHNKSYMIQMPLNMIDLLQY
ncbi:unnamed protein product [Macrosiphum euphorbiae]|nr:unnamed protein product [Macrosiphum euphorbiae]